MLINTLPLQLERLLCLHRANNKLLNYSSVRIISHIFTQCNLNKINMLNISTILHKPGNMFDNGVAADGGGGGQGKLSAGWGRGRSDGLDGTLRYVRATGWSLHAGWSVCVFSSLGIGRTVSNYVQFDVSVHHAHLQHTWPEACTPCSLSWNNRFSVNFVQ